MSIVVPSTSKSVASGSPPTSTEVPPTIAVPAVTSTLSPAITVALPDASTAMPPTTAVPSQVMPDSSSAMLSSPTRVRSSTVTESLVVMRTSPAEAAARSTFSPAITSWT